MTHTAFLDRHRLAAGSLADIALAVQALMNPGALIFGPDGKVIDIESAGALIRDPDGKVVDVDPAKLSPEDGQPGPRSQWPDRHRYLAAQAEAGTSRPVLPVPDNRGPGRPRLGVTAREVTLLPRHWDWLGAQPGSTSVALRKLVEAASREGKSARNEARDAAFRFASAMAGNEPGFEEAMRALVCRQAQALSPPDGNLAAGCARTSGEDGGARVHGR